MAPTVGFMWNRALLSTFAKVWWPGQCVSHSGNWRPFTINGNVNAAQEGVKYLEVFSVVPAGAQANILFKGVARRRSLELRYSAIESVVITYFTLVKGNCCEGHAVRALHVVVEMGITRASPQTKSFAEAGTLLRRPLFHCCCEQQRR